MGATAQSDRGGAEGDQADDEHPPPAELVAERAADEQQRDQGEHVGLDHPLLPGQAGVEAVGDRRQRHVDHGRVEEDDRRAEDRRDQRQTLLAGHRTSVRRRPLRPAALPSGTSARAFTRIPLRDRKGGEMTKTCCWSSLLVLLALRSLATERRGKGPRQMGARNGVTVERIPVPLHRHLTHATPASSPWSSGSTGATAGSIAGGSCAASYDVPAVAYDGSGGGLSADGKTLVLGRFTSAAYVYPPRTTRLAILDTDLRPTDGTCEAGQQRPPLSRSVDLRGHFAFDAISPDGSTIYLIHHFPSLSGPAYITTTRCGR